MQLVNLFIAFLVLSLFFGIVESIRPALKKPRWRKDSKTDLAYWFFTPLVTKTITRVSLIVVAVIMMIFLGQERVETTLQQGWGPFAEWPTWLQAIAVILVGDFLGYWGHRIFHHGRLWDFHAVHHSSEQLDWLSSVRLHPVNDVVMRMAQAVPLFLLGFSGQVLVVYVPLIGLYALFLHANVNWSFGPLRYVIASPRFHRWHHTSEEEGLDKNFSGMLPLWDLVFGTFYMPKGKTPQKFGVIDDEVPSGLWGQLKYPFRKKHPVEEHNAQG